MPRPSGKAKQIAEDTIPGFSIFLREKRRTKKSKKSRRLVHGEMEKASIL